MDSIGAVQCSASEGGISSPNVCVAQGPGPTASPFVSFLKAYDTVMARLHRYWPFMASMAAMVRRLETVVADEAETARVAGVRVPTIKVLQKR